MGIDLQWGYRGRDIGDLEAIGGLAFARNIVQSVVYIDDTELKYAVIGRGREYLVLQNSIVQASESNTRPVAT